MTKEQRDELLVRMARLLESIGSEFVSHRNTIQDDISALNAHLEDIEESAEGRKP